ncbi:MAG: retropepsin-like aspartic protease family protein [Sphingorhabdus sp.]
MNDDAPRLIYAVLLLVLVVSSLVAYRLPLGKMVKMAAAWIGIFALAFIVMSFRPEMNMIWARVTGELTGAPRQSLSGEKLRLTRQDDGHFWLRASVNGTTADFMVDSGASMTAIGADLAKQSSIQLDGNAIEMETANGRITVKTGTVKSFRVGDLQIDDHDVVVADNFGDVNVVGMNFLNSFKSWRVDGDVMELAP